MHQFVRHAVERALAATGAEQPAVSAADRLGLAAARTPPLGPAAGDGRASRTAGSRCGPVARPRRQRAGRPGQAAMTLGAGEPVAVLRDAVRRALPARRGRAPGAARDRRRPSAGLRARAAARHLRAGAEPRRAGAGRHARRARAHRLRAAEAAVRHGRGGCRCSRCWCRRRSPRRRSRWPPRTSTRRCSTRWASRSRALAPATLAVRGVPAPLADADAVTLARAVLPTCASSAAATC